MKDKLESAVLAATQTMAIVNRVALCDLIETLARQSADPSAFVDEMAMRVMIGARIATEADPGVLQQTADSVDVMFRFVHERLATPRG